MSTFQKARPPDGRTEKASCHDHLPKRDPKAGGDCFLRRFVLTAALPGSESQELGRFRTKAEAIQGFEPWQAQGATGQIHSVVGRAIVVGLPIDPNAPPLKKGASRKRSRGPLTAPGVRQTEIGAEIVVTAWGETKSLHEWASDPRAKAGHGAIQQRLSRAKPWSPERAISTPPIDNPLTAHNLAKATRYEAFGESKTVREWLADPRCETSRDALRRKLRQGMPTELALQKHTPPDWCKVGKEFEAFRETKTLKQWAEDPRCKTSYSTLQLRIEEGVPLERALEGRYVRAFGEAKTLAGWARDPRCSVSGVTLRNRVAAGVPLERALTEAIVVKRPIEAFGELKALKDWLRDPRCVVSRPTLDQRLRSGMPLEEALAAKSMHHKVARYEAYGERKTISRWLDDPRCQAAYATVLARVRAGAPFELAIGRPVPTWITHKREAFGETKSVGDWAKDKRCAVSRTTLLTRLRASMPLEQALTQSELG